MAKIPVVSSDIDYRGRKIKTYSYVAVLCERDGSDVSAVRIDNAPNKGDVLTDIEDRFPEWNVKGVYKLYEEDFE